MSSQRLFVAWVVYIWVTKRHLEGMLSSLEKWLIVLCPSLHNYRHGHDPWASSPPSALVWITHQVPSMAQLRDYYILSWISSSGVNSGGGGEVGCVWLCLTPIFINAPMQSLGCSYPWPIYCLCVPILHLPLSFSHTDTRTHTVCCLIQQAERWHHESHQCQQLCRERYVGCCCCQAVGGGWGKVEGVSWTRLQVGVWAPLLCPFLLPIRSRDSAWERETVCLLSVRAAGILPACPSPLPPLPPPHPPACVLTEQKSSSSTAHVFLSFFFFASS